MAICPSFIGAHVMRITRLDNCGRPLYGEDSQAVTDGFVSVEFAPEVEEGEDYTLRNAAGKLCISERGPDALQWINVTIEFCNVDPCLWTIMNPAWPVVKNAQGKSPGCGSVRTSTTPRVLRWSCGPRSPPRARCVMTTRPRTPTPTDTSCPRM